MQGSGTFSVEAAVNTLVPRDGHVLVLINGAYGMRLAKLTQMMGRKVTTFETAEDVPTTAADVDRLLDGRPVDHARRPHPLRDVDRHPESAAGDRRRRRAPRQEPDRRRDELVRRDRRSTRATMPFDALIAASGKCIEGPPGMGFVLVRRSVLEKCAGNSTSLALDLHDQWAYMEKTTQWRYTPPTHVVVAFNAALDQHRRRGRPAGAARALHDELRDARRRHGGARLPVVPRCRESRRRSSYTFHAPADPAYNFKEFYARVRDKGFILYPGKLTQVETFRVGCIGAIGPDEMRAGGHRDPRHAAGDGHPHGDAGGGAPRGRGSGCRSTDYRAVRSRAAISAGASSAGEAAAASGAIAP